MRIVLAALTLLVVASTSAFAQTPTYRAFSDWSVACSNVRSCTAIGFSAQSDSNAWVIVKRSGAPGALPTVQFAVSSAGAARDRKLSVVLHGLKAGGVPVGPFNAISDGAYARARITGPIVKIFVDALVSARSLSISLVDKRSPSERGTVLLDGSAAALRWMDAMQLRAGNVTALVARGPAAASSIPPPPAVPSIAGLRMREVVAPRSAGPNPVRSADPICQSAPPLWLDLTAGNTVRAECVFGGAYNTGYRFFLNKTGGWKPAAFLIPWRTPANQGELVNPALSKNGLILSSFSKGIGLGTCGEYSEWVWTGSEFHLTRYAEMRECSGVTSDDWPVLFESSVRAASR